MVEDQAINRQDIEMHPHLQEEGLQAEVAVTMHQVHQVDQLQHHVDQLQVHTEIQNQQHE